jgi:hypothetical protein
MLAFALSAAAATAGELPTYEAASVPATPVQLSILSPKGAQQQSPAATSTRNDMPASPHQLAVLSPRHRSVAADMTTGSARN